MTARSVLVALAAALLACGVKAPPRPPERAAGHEPSSVTTSSKAP